MAGQVTKVYGRALFEAAAEKGSLSETAEESAALRKILEGNTELTDFLAHPRIDREEKKAFIRKLFEGHMSEELTGLMLAAVDKGRQKWLKGILEEFEKLYREACHIGTVQVEAPGELSPEQKKKIEDRLLETTGFDRLDIAYAVRPELIGGLIIRIGDRVVDSSIKTRLEQMTEKLLSLQLTEGKTGEEGEVVL